MTDREVFSDGIEQDFDKINDDIINKAAATEKSKTDNATVDSIKISPSDAYTNLSAVIDKTESVKDYAISSKSDETAKQRFERIKVELSELKEDLDALSKEVENNFKVTLKDNNSNNPAFVLVFKELNNLQSKINEIYQDPAFKSVLDDEALQTLAEEEKILAIKASKARIPTQVLFDELKNSKSKADKSDVSLVLDSTDDKIKTILIYEDLQRRIKYITSLVGENKNGNNNILSELQKYSNIAKFLDEKERNFLQERVKKMSKDIDMVMKKQKNYQDLASGIDTNRLVELNNGYNKIKKQNDEVPIVFDRLESLKNIHEESANLTMKIQTIRETQNAMISKLRNNNELLAKMDTNLTKNLEIIKDNIKNLDERLKKLGK